MKLRMVLNLKDGIETYSVQVRHLFIWYTEFSSTDKQKANDVYFKIAKSSNVDY